MSNDRSPSELVARVKDALHAAAATLAAASRPFPAVRPALRARAPARRWHWFVIALAAAIAVSLALAIPYGLLHR